MSFFTCTLKYKPIKCLNHVNSHAPITHLTEWQIIFVARSRKKKKLSPRVFYALKLLCTKECTALSFDILVKSRKIVYHYSGLWYLLDKSKLLSSATHTHTKNRLYTVFLIRAWWNRQRNVIALAVVLCLFEVLCNKQNRFEKRLMLLNSIYFAYIYMSMWECKTIRIEWISTLKCPNCLSILEYVLKNLVILLK